MELLHELSGTILWLPTLSGNNDVTVSMVCLDDYEWLDVAVTIVSAYGRHFWIMLYSILICNVSLELFRLLVASPFNLKKGKYLGRKYSSQ